MLSFQAVGVHCRMGRGRTGVMAACYLVRFHGKTPERAIVEIRRHRPYSIETYEQERAVVRYFDCLRGTKTSEIQEIRDCTKNYVIWREHFTWSRTILAMFLFNSHFSVRRICTHSIKKLINKRYIRSFVRVYWINIHVDALKLETRYIFNKYKTNY